MMGADWAFCLRYVLAGAWNSAFGWLVFALLWQLLHEHWHLWGILVAAHVLATTQAFAVQRRFVFGGGKGSLFVQYLKFQFVYLITLAIGGLLVNALVVQGVHVLIAQLLSLLLLAITGFISGRDFVFRDAPNSAAVAIMMLKQGFVRHRQAWMMFGLSMLLLELTMGAKFYAQPTHVGHDFALSATALLEGKYWIDTNGLIAGLFNPPWFTPAWCAGAAFLADPQAAFYSPLQALALIVDPFTATHLCMLLFVATGFWGAYALACKVFAWDHPEAALFSVLGMVHTFVPLRAAVGEAGYLPLHGWTFLALALMWPSATNGPPWLRHGWPAVGVGLCLSAWIQFGFGGMLVPMTLAVLGLVMIAILLGRASWRALIVRLGTGAMLAFALNASRLYENVALLRNFPRDFYALPGIPSLGDVLITIAASLFLPSQWTTEFALPRLQGVRFSVLPHEWALEFGVGALALAAIGLGLAMLRRLAVGTFRPSLRPVLRLASLGWGRAAALLVLVLLAALPVLLLWQQGDLRALIKQVPILNSAAWPMRWIVVLVPLTQFLLAAVLRMSLGSLSAQSNLARLLPWLAVATLWVGPATMPVGYYLDRQWQGYDPRPAQAAFAASKRSAPPPIERVTLEVGAGMGARNDTMFVGASQGLCYNPIYGYRLEAFPQIDRLAEAPALAVFDDSQRTIIRNPACLLHPRENGCRPGDGFLATDPRQIEAAARFVERRPFAWQRPALSQWAAWVSQTTFWLLLAAIGLRLWFGLLRVLGTQPSDDTNVQRAARPS